MQFNRERASTVESQKASLLKQHKAIVSGMQADAAITQAHVVHLEDTLHQTAEKLFLFDSALAVLTENDQTGSIAKAFMKLQKEKVKGDTLLSGVLQQVDFLQGEVCRQHTLLAQTVDTFTLRGMKLARACMLELNGANSKSTHIHARSAAASPRIVFPPDNI